MCGWVGVLWGTVSCAKVRRWNVGAREDSIARPPCMPAACLPRSASPTCSPPPLMCSSMINCFIVTLQVLVGEPSVPDTVQILRGLKERYASHHGVQVGCWAGWESR